jgi:hypothetical protein
MFHGPRCYWGPVWPGSHPTGFNPISGDFGNKHQSPHRVDVMTVVGAENARNWLLGGCGGEERTGTKNSLDGSPKAVQESRGVRSARIPAALEVWIEAMVDGGEFPSHLARAGSKRQSSVDHCPRRHLHCVWFAQKGTGNRQVL